MMTELLFSENFIEGRDWERKNYNLNTIILKEGQHSGKVFIILQGRVRITASVALEGRSIRPGFKELGPLDIFGELALFDATPHGATVIAVSEVEVAEVDAQRLVKFLQCHPEIGCRFYRYLVEVLVARIQGTNQKMLSLLAWGLKSHGYTNYLD